MTSCLLQVVKDGGILTELTLEAITTKVVLDVSGKMDLWCLIQPSQAENAHLASQESNGLLFHHIDQLISQPLTNLICEEVGDHLRPVALPNVLSQWSALERCQRCGWELQDTVGETAFLFSHQRHNLRCCKVCEQVPNLFTQVDNFLAEKTQDRLPRPQLLRIPQVWKLFGEIL